VRRTLLAVAEDPCFYLPSNRRAKFKRPFEFVVSALRVTGAEITDVQALLAALAAMSEPLYRCADPTGYHDHAEAWRDPGAMAARWTFASDLASGRLRGVRIPPALYADLPAGKPREWKDAIARKLLPGGGLDAATSVAVDRVVSAATAAGAKAGPAEAGPRIVALVLGSPEFQKQ
jgi:hypothetical protein